MITTLRQSLKSHAYRIFLWAFLVAMIFSGLSFNFKDTSRWAIKVYNQKITDVQWHQSLINAQRQLDYIKSLGINWPRTESLEQEVLHHSINKLLVQQNAQDLNLAIPDILLHDQLEATLHNLPAHFFDAHGKLNESMFERQIAPQIFEEFINEIENEIKTNLIHSIVDLGSSYVPNFEVTLQCNEEYANKKYSIVKFSLQKAIEKAMQTPVLDEILERFYKKNEHGDTYKTPEQRAGVLWKFNADDYGIQILAKDISAYYEKNKKTDYLETAVQLQVRRIICGSAEQAQAFYEEIKADASLFDVIFKKFATAKQKGQNSVLTDFFTKESMKYDTVLIETAFDKLHQDNDISEVIKTDKGYEILQRVARKAAQYKPLSEVKEQISSKLLEEKFTKRFKQDAERLTNHADYNDSQAITTFIEKRKGHKKSIALEVKKSGVINMHLFQTGKDHYAIFMDDKQGVLLQCQEIVKKTLKPFHEIKSVVVADYYKKQAQLDLQLIVNQVMKEIDHKNLHEIAQHNSAELSYAYFTYKDGRAESSDMLHRPDISQKVKNLQTVGEMVDVVTPHESFIIRLDHIDPIDQQLFEEKENTVKNALSSKAKYRGRDSYIASLCRRATLDNKIEIKDQLLKDAKETV